MERVTPEKNEGAFIEWERERKWSKFVFLILVSLFILVFVVYPLLYPLVRPYVPIAPGKWETAPGVGGPWRIPLIFGMGVGYVIVLIVIRWYFRCSLSECSKDAAVFAAIVTAEDLETGNPVRACLSMDKLLLALSHFLGQKLVTLGLSAVPPGDLMHVTPETISRRAVYRVVQANRDTKDFQERLRDLAIGLAGNVDTGYPAAHKFLVWLDQEAESYRQAPQGFLDKHLTLKTMLLNVCPIILPPLAAIVTAILVSGE